jgi:hypothetical protein
VTEDSEDQTTEDAVAHQRPTLNSAVLRRRADQGFYLRLAETIAQNRLALERLGR